MLELIPLLDRDSDVSMYVQLYQYIKREIENGSIPSQSFLPSIRYLSSHLNVSKTTVESAYQQLLAEGYVTSKSRVGLVVLPVEKPISSLLSPNIEPHNSASIEKGKGIIKYDFKYGDIDLQSFPMKTWKRCLSKSLSINPKMLINTGEQKGDKGLREEIRKYLFQSRGVNCSLEQVVICSGTQSALTLITRLFDADERVAAMEDPSYNIAHSVFNNNNWTIAPIQLDPDGIDIEQLKQTRAKLAYITPSHQFPYGMVLPVQKRLSLLEWANNNKSFVIEDDYDSEFRYQGQPIPSLKTLDPNDRVIYLGTFSKSFTPAVRVSYIVLPKSLLDAYDRTYYNYNQSVSPIIQKGLYVYMNEGHFESHLRRMRNIYQKKHHTLLNALNKYMGNRIEIIGQNAGLHLIMRVEYMSTKDLIHKAKKVGIRVYDPADYLLDKKKRIPSLVMLGFGGLSEAEIDKGISLLSNAWFT